MLLEGKKLLITGVLTDDSIAFAVAKVALEQGAELLLTNVGKGVRLTEKVARKLPSTPDVMQMDVNNPDDIAAVASAVMDRWGRLDGVLHSIGFAPQDALGGNFLNTPWESVAMAFQTSAYSLKALSVGMLEPLKVAGADGGASVLSLTFDARFAWPIYDWMGVAKSGARVDHPLPGARPRPAQHPRQHRLRRTDPLHGRQEHPRLRRHQRHLGRARPAGVVDDRCDAGGRDVRLPALADGVDDDRRDDPRRRRLPRAGDGLQAPRMTELRTAAQHFDEWAPRYDAQIREMVPRYEEIHDTIVALLTLRPPRRILDLGAGTGYTMHRILEAVPGATATGLDVSPEMLQRAGERLTAHGERAELRRSDIAEPEIIGAYDAIVSILAVHHLFPDQKRHLFSRIWEHIEPGGVFVLADYFRPAMDRLSELYDLPDEPDAHEVEHDHPDTAAEHLAWLTAAGFAAVDLVWKYDDVGVIVAWRAERPDR